MADVAAVDDWVVPPTVPAAPPMAGPAGVDDWTVPGAPPRAPAMVNGYAVAPPVPPAAPAPPGHYSAPVGGEFGDLSAQPWAQGAQPDPTAVAPVAASLGRVWDAAVAGARGNPATPEGQAMLDTLRERGGPLVRQIAIPAAQLAAGAVGGVGGAISQGAMELLGEKGGRDALALGAVLPMLHGEAMSPNVAAPAATAEETRPQFVSERFAPVDPHANTLDRITQLINHDNAETAPGGPPDTPQPAPVAPESTGVAPPVAPGAPSVAGADAAPGSVGAAAIDDNGLSGLTPAEEKAYAATASGQKLIERQPVGVEDGSEYIPGVEVNQAERDQTIDSARALKRARTDAPGIAQEQELTNDRNIAKVEGYHEATIRSPVDVMNANAALKAQLDADYPAAFANKTTPDIAPVVQAVRDSLNTPRARQNTQLKQYVAPLLDRLVNKDGSPKILDAEELYGFREDLARMRSKASQVGDPNLSHVSGELGDIVTAADGAIEKAAPGYRSYMDNVSGAKRAIDEMEVLQEEKSRLYDAQNRISYAKFQGMMRRIVDAQQAPGLNQYKSIAPDTMARLWNVRDHLRRADKAFRNGLTPGDSGSAQSLYDMAKGAAAGTAGTAAAGAVGGMIGGYMGMPTIGMTAGLLTKDAIGQYFSGKAATRRTAAGMRMLHPETPLNSLYEPGEAPPAVRPAFVPTPAAARSADSSMGHNGGPPMAAAPDLFTSPAGSPVNDLAVAPGAAPPAPVAAVPPPIPRSVNDTGRVPTPPVAAPVAARAPFSWPLTPEENGLLRGPVNDSGQATAPVNALMLPAPPSVGTKVFTPSGKPIDVRYGVRDASDLVASQLPDGSANPAYPAELQPRDRTRAASQQQVQRIANELNPARLGASASTAEGAPIVGPDGIVESGNGRTLAIQQAYAAGGPQARAYRQWVANQGHDISGIKNPVVVRERIARADETPAQRAALTADMGASPVLAMSAPERAAADAKRIPTDALSLLRGGDVTSAGNANFARAFAQHVVPEGDRATFMNAEGGLSVEGATRMRNALMQRAYGSGDLVRSLAEDADPDIKTFGLALTDATGPMAKLRGAIEARTVEKTHDIAPDIVQAANMIKAARARGGPLGPRLEDALGQSTMLTAPRGALVEPLLRATFGEDLRGRMSRVKTAALLADYSENAQVQSGLLGANQTPGEILAAARSRHGQGIAPRSSGAVAGP